MGYRSLTLAALVACAAAPVTPAPTVVAPRPVTRTQVAVIASSCQPLAVERWAREELLAIHEATTCRYRVTWLGWQPPRDYDYRPDADGFVTDYFISGDVHADVSWNLRTNAVRVRPHGDGVLDQAGAMVAATWAHDTIFRGIDLAQLELQKQ